MKATPEKNRANVKQWRLKNPEKVAIRLRKWRNEHPGSQRIKVARRRALKLAAPGNFSKEDINKLFCKQEGRCANQKCRAALIFGLHIDHKMALSRGGSNWPRNLQLLCQPCNISKGIKTMREWRHG